MSERPDDVWLNFFGIDAKFAEYAYDMVSAGFSAAGSHADAKGGFDGIDIACAGFFDVVFDFFFGDAFAAADDDFIFIYGCDGWWFFCYWGVLYLYSSYRVCFLYGYFK